MHIYGMAPPDYCRGPAYSACPTTATSLRRWTSVSPTFRMRRATTTTSSGRRGSSLPGPSCTESPSPTPPGPRPPCLWGSHEGQRRSGNPCRPSPDQSWLPRVSSDPSDLEEGVSSSHSGPGGISWPNRDLGFYVVNGCQGYFLSFQGLSTVSQSNLRLKLCPFP